MPTLARTVALAALVAATSLGLVGCGGDDGGDSKATTELIAELRAGGMRKAQAECVARAFDDAGFGADEVDAVAAGEVDDLDPDALETYSRSASACLGIEVEIPGG